MATVREPSPWATAPQLEFQLFKNPTKMAKSYHCLRVNLSRLLMQKADEEGGTQFVQEVKISDSPGFVYEIPELPTTPSYFIIVMLPPPDNEYEKHLHGEVKLLFAANTMYHLGFSADDVWRVFDDAILPGVEKQNEAKYNIERLDFGGSYHQIRMDFKKLITGFDGQLDTYKVLVDLQRATRNQIVKVSCRNVVTFSEPIRFPFLFKLHVTNFQQGNLCAVLDGPVKPDEPYRNMSSHFTAWSNYSDKCRGGREKFDAEWELHDAVLNRDLIPGVPTYESLLNFLFLLSNKDHSKTHKDGQPEKHIKHSFSNLEDHKEGEDEDPTSDKDGNGQGGRRCKCTSSAFFFESPVAPYNWIARALDTAEMMTEKMVFLVMIRMPADYNMQPLDENYCNFIGALPMVKCRSENIKHLICISTCEVRGSQDHPQHKVTASLAFNWIGPRMDFIPDTDGTSEGAPRVLACFSKNLLRREAWKLADGRNSQRTYVCIKEAIEAPVLMIGNPAQAYAHISNVGNTNIATTMEFAKMITE